MHGKLLSFVLVIFFFFKHPLQNAGKGKIISLIFGFWCFGYGLLVISAPHILKTMYYKLSEHL